MEKIINVGSRLHNSVVGGALTGANEIKDDTKGKTQDVINQETDAELLRLDGAKQDKLTFDQTPAEGSTNPVTSGGVYASDAALQQAIEAILLLIPSAASALNQLADKSFVNSSIATATATFRGTYNLVTDLELTVSAKHQQIATALASVVSTADNNDYCFVQIPVSDQSTDIRVTERYKFDGTSWEYEYDLNNSGFTAEQWGAINSGITSVLVGKLGALPTAAELATMFAGKQNTLTFDSTPVAGSDNPVKSSGLYNAFAAINALIPEGADANNKLVAESRLVAYVTTLINALDATFDVTSADGHVTLRMTQADGLITSVQILTSDIASDAALTLLGGRVSTAEADIDALQDAYAALTQSDVVIVEGALPSSGQQQNIIYRQPDQDHTSPQYYSDYMWNGTTWVLMATYMNAIDPRPKKGSQNLVTSGGVFDNMGALDVSELNATENPHTLATYADLSAALAAISSDYQKGGMSIKFVLTSDNKYVQYLYVGTSTATADFTNVVNWQKINIEKEFQLVKDNNGNIPLTLILFTDYYYIDTLYEFVPNDGENITPSSTGAELRCAIIPVEEGDVFLLNNEGGNYDKTAYVWVAADFSIIGRSDANHICQEESVIAPENAKWLCLNDNIIGNQSYKGKNLPYMIDEKAKAEKERAEAVEQVLNTEVTSNYLIQADNVGGIDLQKINAFVEKKYVDTSGSSAPNDGTNITYSDNSNYDCAVIPVIEGDTFLLNLVGGYSWSRAYAWVKADFSFVSKSGSSYTCNQETIIAPANAAFLVLNANNESPIHCYKGNSFKNYVDTYVSGVENATTEIDTIKIGSQQYDVAAKKASERLIGAVTLASGSGSVSADGGATQNIIANTNISINKGSILKISISGFNTYIDSAELYLDGVRGTYIYNSEAIFECQSDVSIIRLLTRSGNVIASGTVTGSVTLLNVYESLKEVGEKSPDYGEVKQRSEESDVNINKTITPIWRNTFLLNNASGETSSTEYISSDFIPVDTIRYLRITCSYEYSIFTFDKNKIRKATYNYSAGNNVISFNSKPEDASIKYIRIRVKTNNSANVTLAVDSLVSRYNNERLLANKNLKCFAHRGSGLRAYPLGNGDNYPSSIWGSYLNGFDGLHINIQFTSDHVPYCLHDSTFTDGVSGQEINLNNSTSEQIDACTRNGQPIAKVESAIYMAKMMGLDIILYNIYGTYTTEDYGVLINLVKKYSMFEHAYFGVMGAVGSPNASYLQDIVSAYPKAKILRTEDDITSTKPESITALIADAESILQSYPDLTVYMWLNSGHSEQQFIDANLAKPYNVKIGVHSLGAEKYAAIMPYIDIYTQSGGRQSFGMDRRDVEKIVTDKYPEFLLGDFGNIV